MRRKPPPKAKGEAKAAAAVAKAEAKAAADAAKAEAKAAAAKAKVEAKEAAIAAKAAALKAIEDAKPKIRWPKLTSPTAYPLEESFRTPEESEFELLLDVRAIGRPPHFEMLRRCQWVCQEAPRMIPRDEAEPCLCRPDSQMLAVIAMAKEAAAAAKKEAAATAAAALATVATAATAA